jgi:PTH1 family peptidyl-tRNA hydrolase
VESVIEALGSKEFPRVRVGVGRPPGEGEPIDYLLDAPGAEDAAILQEAVDRAADAIEVFLGHGIVSAMNRFNAHA